MKLNLSKERCERLAAMEGDSTVGAGCPPLSGSPLPVGTRVRFLKTLEEYGCDGYPPRHYATKGELGTVAEGQYPCSEGHWVFWDGWPSAPFGATLGVDFEVYEENVNVLARKLQRSPKMSDTENLNEAADSGLLQPRLVRPYVEADYINALAEKHGQLREMQADMLVMQTVEMERTDELARAIGISTGRESWWGSTAAEKHNVLMTRIKRLRANDAVVATAPPMPIAE